MKEVADYHLDHLHSEIISLKEEVSKHSNFQEDS